MKLIAASVLVMTDCYFSHAAATGGGTYPEKRMIHNKN